MRPIDKTAILAAAFAIATERGVRAVTRSAVARRAGVSTGVISKAHGTMGALRREVMREAVRREHHAVIAEGLATGDPEARAAPDEVRAAAAASLV